MTKRISAKGCLVGGAELAFGLVLAGMAGTVNTIAQLVIIGVSILVAVFSVFGGGRDEPDKAATPLIDSSAAGDSSDSEKTDGDGMTDDDTRPKE